MCLHISTGPQLTSMKLLEHSDLFFECLHLQQDMQGSKSG